MDEPRVEDFMDNDDIGVEKEQVAALSTPIPTDYYTAKFVGLKLNEYTDPETKEKVVKGYVHPTGSGGKKVMPLFTLISDDPAVNGRPMSAHCSITTKLFSQLDKELDLMTGTRIDPEKVKEAKDKVVRLKVNFKDEETREMIDPVTLEKVERTFAAKNEIGAILKYRE